MTCAQTAIIPKNSASDVSAAASTTTARTMANPSEHFGNIVPFLFSRQGGSAGVNGAVNET